MISSRYQFYNPKLANKRRGNPYFADKRADRFGTSRVKSTMAKISPRVWLWLFLFIVIITLLGWLLFFSNVLIIKNIEVQGAAIVPTSDIENLASEQLDHNRLLVFSEKHLAAFNSNKFKKDLLDHYALDKVEIIKKIPATLVIKITEKNPTAVWFEADTYNEIDSSGWILALVGGPITGLPTIYNNGWPKINNRKIEIDNKVISFSQALNQDFASRFNNIKLKQLIIDNEKDTVKLAPEKGAMIYFSTLDDLNKQLDRFDVLLHSELSGKFEKVHYIDLRFGDKVYYQ